MARNRRQRSYPPRQQVAPRAQQAQQQIAVTQQWAGILPPPQALQGFENVIPGSANRILVMAESEAKHRHKQDNYFSVYRFLALGIGAVIAIGGLLLCAYLIKKGQTGWAVGAFLGEITALAALFVVGRYYRVNLGGGSQ